MIRLSKNDRYNLFRRLIINRSNAILNSKEYSPLSASLSESELQKLDEYFEQIASFEAEYLIKKYPKENDITDQHIQESLKLMFEILASIDNKETDEQSSCL
jgi:hypothetical protein